MGQTIGYTKPNKAERMMKNVRRVYVLFDVANGAVGRALGRQGRGTNRGGTGRGSRTPTKSLLTVYHKIVLGKEKNQKKYTYLKFWFTFFGNHGIVSLLHIAV